MVFTGRTSILSILLALSAGMCAQSSSPAELVTTGNTIIDGQSMPYQIRHLPVSSYPELPAVIASELIEMGCVIPQTYQARRPENVVHASLERAGSSDWAVLCSSAGNVSLLVFFGSEPLRHVQLASAPEVQRLQKHLGTEVLGFNWGIDPASPERIRQAQIGLSPRPPKLDHDALADSVIDYKTIYRFYANGKWTIVDLPD